MPNTKSLSHADRKMKKRAGRKALKAIESGLSHTQRTALRRARAEKHVGVKAFLAKAK